ncbi:radical SAM/SPASM domain-containing protein [Clostridium akagii]|uniref:radical SAM/SPASM domain-containing protein n=1 Tax=Clostridium akagii TaxID=91623 RepID=UPI00047C15DF|nr:radical SAM protein [Clostridium akagii]
MHHLFDKEGKRFLFDSNEIRLYRVPEKYKGIIDKNGIGDINFNKREVNIQIKDKDLNKCSKLVLIISKVCNLNCKYCYASGGNYGDKESLMMDLETLMKSIEVTLDIFPKGIECIQFFGGEPLTNYKILRDGILFINELFKKRNLKKPNYTIVTNGTIINEEIIEIFNDFFQSVTISLDGKKEINDYNRIFKNNNHSVHDSVIKNIELMNKSRPYLLDIEMTVDDKQIDYFISKNNIDNFKYIKTLKVDSVHMTPVIDCKNVMSDSEKRRKESRVKYFDLCIKESLKGKAKEINLVKAKSIIQILKNKIISEHFCSAGISTITVDEKGNIYPCFMFGEVDEFVMSNINNFLQEDFNKIRQKFIDNKIVNNNKCKTCWANTICSEACSGCVGSFYLTNKNISEVIDEHCDIGKSGLERVLYQVYEYSESKKLK